MAKASFLFTEDENEDELACGVPLDLVEDHPLPTLVDEPAGEIHPESVLLDPGDIELDTVTDIRSSIESTESIREFAAQIDANGGWTTPVLVRPPAVQGGKHRVIAGRRRIAAAAVNHDQVVAYVIHCDDTTARRLAFEENHRRKGFTVIDYAKLFLEARGEKYLPNWSERVSKQFGVSRATVTEAIKTYEAIQHDPALVAKVATGEMKADAAAALAKVCVEERAVKLFDAQLLADAEATRKRAKANGKTSKNQSTPVDEETLRKQCAQLMLLEQKRVEHDARVNYPVVFIPRTEEEIMAQLRARGTEKPKAALGGTDDKEESGEGATERKQGKDKTPVPAKVRAKHVRAAVAHGKEPVVAPATVVLTESLVPIPPNGELKRQLAELIDPAYPEIMNRFIAYACCIDASANWNMDGLVQRWRAIAMEIEAKMPLVSLSAFGPAVHIPTDVEIEGKMPKKPKQKIKSSEKLKSKSKSATKSKPAKKQSAKTPAKSPRK